MKIIPVRPVPDEIYEKLGFYWYASPQDKSYVAGELVVVSKKEGDAYYSAANELYDMYVQAGQYVIDRKLYAELDIPPSLVEMIETSWEDDSHFHLLGRFDLAGGLDGLPIKLIEFNADTPSLIFEVALVQWLLLKHNKMTEENQYNNLYEAIKESFGRLKARHPVFGKADDRIAHALFSCLEGAGAEDENTVRLIEEIAYEAGFITGFDYVEKVFFGAEEGILDKEGNAFDYWFKLLPYEHICVHEPELAVLLTEILRRKRCILLNPPYTLLFQSKMIMKVLWDLFPNHPLLLETDTRYLTGKKCVEKRTFSREGDNIRVFDAQRNVIDMRHGEYAMYGKIYQAWADLPQDAEGRLYQAGVFFSYEACGLGFRREKGIIHNQSQFAGHYVEG
ncbi:MAG: glutathionylspermidine synthase [Deltaproteobacteria bacterium HGW-Deltaproteobacteria-6]|nr:MAG: glutathionylspermidine synthase [Deltaproteobacteria bacterium HGW-Deltaproteobacteria-6]